jgi:uncharacterized protein
MEGALGRVVTDNHALLDAILVDYRLPPMGLHGISHWARVLENGRRVAALTGARIEIVELFALLHDARRLNERVDHGHGLRAAEWSRTLRGSLLSLGDEDFELLFYACAHHTDGQRHEDITVGTCWDADRLDLARAGINPNPRYLCTEPACDPQILRWAIERSLARTLPGLVRSEWGLAGGEHVRNS